jgi:hypothetical protein
VAVEALLSMDISTQSHSFAVSVRQSAQLPAFASAGRTASEEGDPTELMVAKDWP